MISQDAPKTGCVIYWPVVHVRIPLTCKQGLAIGTPGQADALGIAALPALVDEILGLELVHLALLLEVEDDDVGRRRGAQPVPIRREDERVDDVAGVERVQVLRLVEIPEHRRAVLAARRAQGAVRRDGHGVDVPAVPDMIGLQFARGQLPHLATASVIWQGD